MQGERILRAMEPCPAQLRLLLEQLGQTARMFNEPKRRDAVRLAAAIASHMDEVAHAPDRGALG